MRYPIPDQATHSTATVAILAIIGGCGAAMVLPRRQWPFALAGMAAPIALYALAGYILSGMYASGAVPRRARELPFRDEMRYWALPWKHNERSAELFAEAVREQFKERKGSLLWADATTVTTVMATQTAKECGRRWLRYKDIQFERELDSGPWPRVAYDGFHSRGRASEFWLETHYIPAAAKGRFYVVSPVPGYAPEGVLERMDFEPDGVVHRAILKTDSQ